VKFLLRISSKGPNNLAKLFLSKETTVQSVSAITEAALKEFLSKAISPKYSPGL